MQIILSRFFIKRPCRSAKKTAPVRRRTAVSFAVAPDIPVALIIILGAAGRFKPRMFIGRMVEHQIHYDFNIASARFAYQIFHIRHSSVFRRYSTVIGDIVTAVDKR